MERNGYSIDFSEIYEKFQVSANEVVYEEFDDIQDAIEWAESN